MVERRSVAPDGVGSSPTTHPNETLVIISLQSYFLACARHVPNLVFSPSLDKVEALLHRNSSPATPNRIHC